jgi:hypothetical protein
VTAAGDGRDPELQAAVDNETRILAAALAAIAALQDPDAWARAHIEGMYGRGWRPWPRSDRIPPRGEGDPAVTKRGAAAVRKALNLDPKETR